MNNIYSEFGNIENQIMNMGIPFIGEQRNKNNKSWNSNFKYWDSIAKNEYK